MAALLDFTPILNEHSFTSMPRQSDPPPITRPKFRVNEQARAHSPRRHRRLRAERVLQRQGLGDRESGRRCRRHDLPLLRRQGRPAHHDLPRAHAQLPAVARARSRRRSRGPRTGCASPSATIWRPSAATAALAIVSQVELRHSLKFMSLLSQQEVADYLNILRKIVEHGQTEGVFRRNLHPALVAKAVFGIRRRDGDVVDPVGKGLRRSPIRPSRSRSSFSTACCSRLRVVTY